MDQSYTDSDISLSPTKIFDRLQVLRQLQILQRGKLQKQCLQYQDSPETSSNLTEIVSQFSNSTNYNTFRSFLQSSCDSSNEVTPRQGVCISPNLSLKLKEKDLVEGVKALNLSQESECIISSPLSSRSRGSAPSRNGNEENPTRKNTENKQKQISLDEMPILSPKKDFETMLLEKLKNEKPPKPRSPKQETAPVMRNKKPFLKRGDGMTRFGLKKTDLVIQNTKSLPWHRKSLETRIIHTPQKVKKSDEVQIMVNETKKPQPAFKEEKPNVKMGKPKEIQDNKNKYQGPKQKDSHDETSASDKTTDTNDNNIHHKLPEPKIQLPKGKHPLRIEKGKTWAAVLSKEQSEFLRQLKQSDYYKNFASPAKSTISDVSCNEAMHKQQQEREIAEQNMFELLENKVTNESFNLENSFINRFLKRSLECSGDSTPMNIQKCLADNPNLLHIFPDIHKKSTLPVSECSCEYTDYSDNCSVSSCSSCKIIEESNYEPTSPNKNVQKDGKQKEPSNRPKRVDIVKKTKDTCQNQNDAVTETDVIKANMEEMNAKLVATSELLKDRLQELEDEIETFRKENSHLAKLREEIDSERQKFYEEKNAFEQKFNEEKILSEYYLAEEKEKLNKQKQTYERYVREMRGRLNKKDKDEVVSLKKEINDLKEEIRIKDAKSTSTIARLRNQLKIMEKEKNNLQEEIEKLKKENRRIQHSNEITRRLTNVKYLEEINKKLSHMSKNTHSEINLDNDVKYKAYEIERQSRSRRVQPVVKTVSRQRAKSVPNLNVTSRYAKYFSQRDALSHGEKNETINIDRVERFTYTSDDDLDDDNKQQSDDLELLGDNDDEHLNEEDNHLEKIYIERFQSNSPKNQESQPPNDQRKYYDNIDTFFMRKSNSRNSKSPRDNISEGFTYRSKSPISILSNRSNGRKSPMKEPLVVNHSGDSFSSPKSPISTFDTRSFGSQKPPTVINHDEYRDKLLAVSPEPSTSNTNNVAKTSLNPTEIKKSDGSRELRFPNGNVKYISADGKYSKFLYYNGDIKENFYKEGRIKYYYAEAKTFHTTHADGLEVLEFPDGQVEKRYKDGSSEIRLPNGSIRYHDPKNEHVREEWRFPDGTALTVSANGDQRIVFSNGQVEVHAKDHKRREFPDGTVKLVYTDGTSETRYASGRVRIKDKHGNLIMDSTPHEQK